MTEASHKRPRIERPQRKLRAPPAAQRIAVPSAPTELDSFARIDWALRKIMGEVKDNRGEYPYSSRAPTIREVLFRAGLSARYLENQNGTRSRETLKARCKEKIKRVLRRVKSGRYHAARRTHKADGNRHEPSHWVELREKLQSLKQRWVEQELEYVDAQNCIQEYEKRLRELTAEVDRLRNLLAASNVHILHRPTGQ